MNFLIRDCSVDQFSEEEIHRALGIFASNSCNMASFRGRGLFPTFSLINHSCVRNARHIISSDERLMEIVAQQDIRDGEEINVRYTTGVLEPLTSRQETITNQWHFTCGCVRCRDPTEMGTFASCFRCNVCQDLVMPPHDNSSSNWVCRGCDKTFPRSQLEVTLKKLKISLDNVPADQPDKLESFLKIASKILHSNHCMLMEIKQRLMCLYGTTTNPALISRKLDLAEEVMEVMDKLDPGLTAWRGKLVYDVTRFRLVKTLQDLQARRLGLDKVELSLRGAVEDLEMAVSGLTGEKFGGKGGSLRQRMVALCGVQLLGDGYRMLLSTYLKMPFL